MAYTSRPRESDRKSLAASERCYSDRTPPTQKQAEVLRLMLDHFREHQRYPTVKELAEALSVTDTAAHDRLKGLQRKGWISRTGNGSRGSWRVEDLIVGATLPKACMEHLVTALAGG